MLKSQFSFTVVLLLVHTPLAEAQLFRVVVDPGHGGADHGTVFENGTVRIAEKDVTIVLARQVKRHLQARGYLVTLTRNGDQEVPLAARTALANRLGADVFISIHMNSTQGIRISDAQGVETYILNNATDASSRRLARLENAVISTSAHASPEEMDVALILKDLRLDANLSESKRLACHLQTRLVTATSKLKPRYAPSAHRDRGVKQALFQVLLGADMPSVLVEAGFLSHPHDRSLVLAPRGQLAMSRAIADAIDLYRHQSRRSGNSLALGRCKVN